jgi:hypothetical protein
LRLENKHDWKLIWWIEIVYRNYSGLLTLTLDTNTLDDGSWRSVSYLRLSSDNNILDVKDVTIIRKE